MLTLDLTGAAMTVALLLMGGWYGLWRPSAAVAELTRLRKEMDLKCKDQATLERETATFNTTLQERQRELAGTGAPPAKSPIEEDLRTITESMRRHGLRVSEVGPLGSTAYPGVLESRYRVRAGGTCAEIVRAFQDFEACRFWGDITHLQIGAPGSEKGQGTDTREIELCVSFYSAAARPEPSADGK